MTHEPPPSYEAVVAMSEVVVPQSSSSVASPPPDYQHGRLTPTEEMQHYQHQDEYQVVPPRFKRKYLPLALRKTTTSSGFYKYFSPTEMETSLDVRDGSSVSHDRQQLQQTHHQTTTVYHHGCPLCGNVVQQMHHQQQPQRVVEALAATSTSDTNCDCNENTEMDVEEDVGVGSEEQQQETQEIQSPNCLTRINNNNVAEPSTSTAATSACNNNYQSNDLRNDNNNGNSATSSILDLDSINENGIIRLDMSKIIDKTGLPTYEAALKLESSGYV